MRNQEKLSGYPWARAFCAYVICAASYLLAQAPPKGDDSRIELNFPENVELSVLVQYVSDRLGINIVYDERIAKKQITILSPAPVNKSALLGLLQSSLQFKELALVDMPEAGWKKVVPATNLTDVSGSPQDKPRVDDKAPAITRVFSLENVSAQRAEQFIKPFLSRPGASSLIIPEQGLLIVTDYASSMDRIEKLIRLGDRPPKQVSLELVPVHNADAAQLSAQVKQMLALKGRARGDRAAAEAATVELVADSRTNQIVVVGPSSESAEAIALIQALDVPLNEVVSPIRFYKLANTTAVDVLATIRAIEADEGHVSVEEDESPPELLSPPAPKPPPLPETPAEAAPGQGVTNPAPKRSIDYQATAGPEPGESLFGKPAAPPAATPPAAGTSFKSKRARVTADVNTNSIIVLGDQGVQEIYEHLIRRLDQKRPQVLLETTIVVLDTSHDFQLGVEISGRTTGNPRLMTFSSFGLSEVDPDTGALKLTPGLGFNGAVITTDVADVIIRALKRNGRAKVISAPRILVNDNAVGKLASTTQEPYESINASDTVATTSFGGFVEAGTSIALTPHISNADYLQLEYAVELSSFRGERRDKLPPPRLQNKVESKVTVPDGYTVIAGGLNRHDTSHTVTSVPFLGDIPIVKYLFRNQIDADTRNTLFVFIRPVIFRDDRFAQLRFLSEQDADRAEIQGDYPNSEPRLMR